MRDRVELLLGGRVRGMWVMTFHAACARMLRAEAPRLGYTRTFTIYDQADARRLTKRCLGRARRDPKRFTPAAVHNQISDAKNKLRDAEAYRQLVGSFFESTVADVYDLYEREMHRANAMDFDDLLVRTVNVLELFQEVRDHYQAVFRHVLVDEYQDTNHAQYRLLQLITNEHRNLAVVGDDAQCLVAGHAGDDGGRTRRSRSSASSRATRCCPATAAATSVPRRVTETFASQASMGVAITTRSGRRIVSTPEHTHFAGFKPGLTPQHHLTYVMRRRGVGFRVGTTRAYTDGRNAGVLGVQCDAARSMRTPRGSWRRTRRRPQARVAEIRLSLQYRHPDAPVRRAAGRREWPRRRPVAHRRGVRAVDSFGGGLRLLHDHGLSIRPPARHAAHVRGPSPAGDAHALRRSAGSHADAPRRRRRARSGGRGGAARRRAQRAAGEERLGQLALRVVLQGLRRRGRRRGPDPRRAPASASGVLARLGDAAATERTQRPAVHPRRIRASRDGDVHRGRRLRRRRAGREGPARRDGARHQRRAHAQLRRERARHPQLDLRLPRRRHPQPPGLRGRLSRRDGRQARAELPLDADDPERRERGHLQQPRAEAQVAVDGPRRRRPDPHPRDGRRARRGAVRRRARSSGCSTPGSAARRSPSSTGRTRSPGSWRTRWSAARSPTRSSAGRSSTTAPRSRTRWPTSSSWPTRRTPTPSPASPTPRAAASAATSLSRVLDARGDARHPGLGRRGRPGRRPRARDRRA